MAKTLLAILSCLGLLLAVPAPAAAQSCPSYVTDNPNRSTLYLVYSPVDDPAFPSYLGYPTSPLGAFDLNALDPAIGTETQLRGRVHELMEAGYCEFDVDVKTTTALPASPPEARWQIVGIGTDSSGGPVGLAQDVDTGDADPQDYARIWGLELVTFAGSELVGAGSTLERWARAIANIAAHESGHNYGLSHAMGVAEP